MVRLTAARNGAAPRLNQAVQFGAQPLENPRAGDIHGPYGHAKLLSHFVGPAVV